MPIEATPEDLELDRLAARAAGIHLHHWNENLQRWMTSSVQDGDPDGSWSARDDDGDALRLAVKLGVLFKPSFAHFIGLERFACQGDEESATRRAIVRAAAEIGRRMA